MQSCCTGVGKLIVIPVGLVHFCTGLSPRNPRPTGGALPILQHNMFATVANNDCSPEMTHHSSLYYHAQILSCPNAYYRTVLASLLFMVDHV
jgi:hypothetical protein